MKMDIRQDIAIKVFGEDGTTLMNKKDTKINRNDMLELTRRMTLSRNCFVRAAGAYIDAEGYSGASGRRISEQDNRSVI